MAARVEANGRRGVQCVAVAHIGQKGQNYRYIHKILFSCAYYLLYSLRYMDI